MFQFIDFHCDLLSYLADDHTRTPNDPISRCSIPQLKSGQVILQIAAIYSDTKKDSTRTFFKQLDLFHHLPSYGGQLLSSDISFPPKELTFCLAIENASTFCEEEEPLNVGLARLEKALQLAPIAYMSLTWNYENRFGGGNETSIGLKEDGKKLLEQIAQKQIAIDLSHTSDLLAEEIFSFIDQEKLPLIPIASHSNFRAIYDHPRNLPDWCAKEIWKRGGIIALNAIHKFIGPSFFDNFVLNIEHGLKLGGEKKLCMGADFFCTKDFISLLNFNSISSFHDILNNASCYPDFFTQLSNKLPNDTLHSIASENAARFLTTFFKQKQATCT